MTEKTKKFVIIAMARTGSNALVAMLNRNDACTCTHELFHQDQIPGPCAPLATTAERDADPFAFLDKAEAFLRTRKPGASHFGFKLFFEHNMPLMDQLITDPDWQVIVLRRPNLLDQYLSLRIAEETQVWNSSEGDKTAKVSLSIKEFCAYKQACETLYSDAEEQLASAGKAYFSISYDDIAAQNYAALLDFLGLPAMANTNVALRKQNPHGTADKLLDPVGTKRALEGAGLGHYWVD